MKKSEGNILIITHWSYKDALVQTYTLPYVDIIRSVLPTNHKIFLVTSEQGNLALAKEDIDKINTGWQQKNMQLVSFTYHRFGIKKLLSIPGQLLQLYKLIRKNNISRIHSVCNIPGGMAYILSSLTGVPMIADSYEPHAEVMVENGTWKKNSLAFKILFRLEKLFTKKAICFIGTTAAMEEYAYTRFNTSIRNLFVKPACVNFSKFHPDEKKKELVEKYGLENKVVCVYAGKLGGIYLKEELFDFIKCCYDHWGDRFRFFMITNAGREEISGQLKRTGTPEHVVISKFCLHHEVADHLSLGDFGINPVKPGPTRRYCTSIKDGEYWAKGLPVVITKNVSDDSGIIEENNIGAVLDDLNEDEYKKAIYRIDELLRENRKDLQAKIYGIAKKYRDYSIAETIYTSIYSEN